MVDPTRLIHLDASPGLAAWLAEAGASLAFTSYRSGELFTLGTGPGGRLTATNVGLPRAMGLGAGCSGLWAAAETQLWRFENILPPGQTHDGHDALLVPLTAHTTGALDIHDIAEMPDGTPVFAAPRFNCLARLAPGHSFEAVWIPPFIDALVPEDRCHLNGLALRDGRPFAVTAIAATNRSGAWRDHKRDGGVVIEVATGETLAHGLSMPHSPRWHDGRLWLHQSGTGEFGWIDLATGHFEPVAFLPGFLRGLSFLGPFALVGLSRPREDSGFDGLPLQARLDREGRAADCALCLLDLRRGEIAHTVRIGPDVDEIYDTAVLPGWRNPKLLRPTGDDVRYLVRPLDGRQRQDDIRKG